MRNRPLLTLTLCLTASLLALAAAGGDSEDAAPAAGAAIEAMIRDFGRDFESDPFASEPLNFGIRVTDAEPSEWTVSVGPAEEPGKVASIEVTAGFPEEPVAFYVTDTQTLTKMYRGEMASLTAMGKARSKDPAPLEMEAMDGFEATPEAIDRLKRLSFHFWTRGNPEIVPWGREELTRVVHGASTGLIYYQPGFRSGWFYLTKGQHANAEVDDQTNPFPTLLILVDGTAKSRIGGKPVTLRGGEAVLIPTGVSHELWNEEESPVRGILLMFGEGA